MSSTLIGKSVERPNAVTFINGRGRYLDDIALHGMLHVFYVRSPHAHARITDIDVADAANSPGVVAVITGHDIRAHCHPWTPVLTHLGEMKTASQVALPTDVVRWQGEPVVAVVAESRAYAEDAADLVQIDFEELPAVSDIEAALDDQGELVHPELGTNVAWRIDIDAGDTTAALARAHAVVERTFLIGRQTGITLEPRGLIADHDPARGYLTLHHCTQVPAHHAFGVRAGVRLAGKSVAYYLPGSWRWFWTQTAHLSRRSGDCGYQHAAWTAGEVRCGSIGIISFRYSLSWPSCGGENGCRRRRQDRSGRNR